MYNVLRQERPGGPVVSRKRKELANDDGVMENMEYLTFPGLEELNMISHLFTTREGGVSGGMYRSLNLSYTRGDDPARVTENYRRVAQALGCAPEDIVCSQQTHTTNIRRITEADRGKGVTRPLDYADVDGLITDVPGIALATVYADCVPLYLVDPVCPAIGLAHAGWRGTVACMGACMVKAMEEQFGTCPENLRAAVGPSICWECYEVGEEVAAAFRPLQEGLAETFTEIRKSGLFSARDCMLLREGKSRGKYQLNLWLANLAVLRASGIPLENISVTDICTCHNPEYLFSHRASHGKRGNLGAFLMLKNI